MHPMASYARRSKGLLSKTNEILLKKGCPHPAWKMLPCSRQCYKTHRRKKGGVGWPNPSMCGRSLKPLSRDLHPDPSRDQPFPSCLIVSSGGRGFISSFQQAFHFQAHRSLLLPVAVPLRCFKHRAASRLPSGLGCCLGSMSSAR